MLAHEIEEPSVTIPCLLMNPIDGSNKKEGWKTHRKDKAQYDLSSYEHL